MLSLHRRPRPGLNEGGDERLDTLLEFAPAQAAQEDRVWWFLKLVSWLRPVEAAPATPARGHSFPRLEAGASAREQNNVRLRYLRAQLDRHPEWRASVARALSELVASCDIAEFLAYAGIPRDFHFLGALSQAARAHLLPGPCRTRDAGQVVAMAFQETDHEWLAELCASEWLGELVDPALHVSLTQALSAALIELAHQVVTQARAPSVRNLSALERSPFSGLYEAVQTLDRDPSQEPHARAVNGRITQCLAAVEAYRAGLSERGAELNTTFQLVRLRRQLRRLSALAALRHDPSPERIGQTLATLVQQAVRGAAGKRLLWSSADLLVQNLVDTAASVGRDYLDQVQASTWSAFRAGAWGGLLMALATCIKFSIAALHLPTLYEGLAFSLNYASVFCAAYLLHFTIATKLPAHTAAALARGLQEGPSFRTRLEQFLVSFRAMVRLQLAGLLGNVVVAGPAAAALALVFRDLVAHPLLTQEKARHVFHEQSLLGPSVIYAGLTGVLLWISSLVGALVDNWVRVHSLSDRLATSAVAMRRFNPERARARAEGLTQRLGGLASNVTLGLLLGGVPTLFALAQLPVQIRHVTVSVSSVAMAMVTKQGDISVVAWAWAGVIGIGITNVLVSFCLALWLALQATRGLERDASSAALVRLGIERWLGRKRFAPLPKREFG